MAPPIVYVDVSAIREGSTRELEAAMNNLSRFVEAHMPRVAFYGFFLDEARATITVVAVHPRLGLARVPRGRGTQVVATYQRWLG